MPVTDSALWINSAFADFDLGITTAIHGLYELGGAWITPILEFFSFLCDPATIIIIAVVLAFFKQTRRFGLAVLLGVTVGALLTNCCLKLLIARPRPYADEASMYHQFWLLMGQHMESDNSFPSGHTTAAFASATAIFLRCNKKYSWLAYIAAFLVAVSRIYLVVHYPSDVMVGIVVGILAGMIGTLVAIKLPEICYEFDFLKLIIKQKKGKHEKASGE